MIVVNLGAARDQPGSIHPFENAHWKILAPLELEAAHDIVTGSMEVGYKFPTGWMGRDARYCCRLTLG